MLRSNKGITMIALIITIIVVSILAAIATNSGITTAEMSRYYQAVSEMKIMQSEVNEWYEYQKNSEPSGWDKGVEIIESGRALDAMKAYNTASDNNINNEDIGEIENYKYFSIDCIKNQLDIDGIDYDFIINIQTRTVILLDGIEMDGKTYYSLGEIEGEQYNVQYIE